MGSLDGASGSIYTGSGGPEIGEVRYWRPLDGPKGHSHRYTGNGDLQEVFR